MSSSDGARVRVVVAPSRVATVVAAGALVALATAGTSLLVLSTTSGPGAGDAPLPQAAPQAGDPPRGVVQVPPRPDGAADVPERLPVGERPGAGPTVLLPTAGLPLADIVPGAPVPPSSPATPDERVPGPGSGAVGAPVVVPDPPTSRPPDAPRGPRPVPDGATGTRPDSCARALPAFERRMARSGVDDGRPAVRARTTPRPVPGNACGHLVAPGQGSPDRGGVAPPPAPGAPAPGRPAAEPPAKGTSKAGASPERGPGSKAHGGSASKAEGKGNSRAKGAPEGKAKGKAESRAESKAKGKAASTGKGGPANKGKGGGSRARGAGKR